VRVLPSAAAGPAAGPVLTGTLEVGLAQDGFDPRRARWKYSVGQWLPELRLPAVVRMCHLCSSRLQCGQHTVRLGRDRRDRRIVPGGGRRLVTWRRWRWPGATVQPGGGLGEAAIQGGAVRSERLVWRACAVMYGRGERQRALADLVHGGQQTAQGPVVGTPAGRLGQGAPDRVPGLCARGGRPAVSIAQTAGHRRPRRRSGSRRATGPRP